MDYRFADDLISIREILDLSQSDLSSQLNVMQATISRNESGKTEPSPKLIEQVYSYAFRNNVRLNKLKEMFWEESMSDGHKLLFHGSKAGINGPISIKAGRANNDFGRGLYTGESYEQAASFISGFDNSSVYLLDLAPGDLKCRKYNVDQDWMLTIAYYRGAIEQYKEHPVIKDLIRKSRECDYIIAPIADNRMFQIIDSFIFGEITDGQCRHCLAATDLGNQYVFISDKAASCVKILEHCYVSRAEKEYYNRKKEEDLRLGDNKVKLARIKYRGKGRYIDEILV